MSIKLVRERVVESVTDGDVNATEVKEDEAAKQQSIFISFPHY